MAARRYEISLLVWKNISLVRCANSRNIFQHSKRNFVSPRDHVISSIYYITSQNYAFCHIYFGVDRTIINVVESGTTMRRCGPGAAGMFTLYSAIRNLFKEWHTAE